MNEIPSGWAWSTVGDLCTLIRGVTYKKEESSSAEREDTIPIIRAGNLTDAGIDLTDDLVWVPTTRVSAEQILRKNDVVVATSSGSVKVVGKSVQVPLDWHGAHGGFMNVLRPDPGIDAAVIGWYLRSAVVRTRWSDLAKGTNINNLKRNHLEDTPVPIAPLPEQHLIAAAIEAHFAQIDAAERSLGLAAKRLGYTLERSHSHGGLRSAVLAAAFSGELVRQDPVDEPASKLLERIAFERSASKSTRKKKAAS